MGQVNGDQSQERKQYQILDQCRDITTALDYLKNKNIPQLAQLQRQILEDPNASTDTALNRSWHQLNNETYSSYVALKARLQKVMDTPGANSDLNRPQVTRTKDRLRDELQEFQQFQNAYLNQLRAVMKRQWKTVQPNATDAEVEQLVNSGQTQVFSTQVR
jgi:syntaxin 1B/2/3